MYSMSHARILFSTENAPVTEYLHYITKSLGTFAFTCRSHSWSV